MLPVLISLTIIMFLPIMLSLGSIQFRTKQLGKVDIQTPRVQAAKLTGAGQRIVDAQHNAWEALALFITALLICNFTGMSYDAILYPTLLFVGARLLHALFYILGVGILRFFSFMVSMIALSWMLVLAFQAA